MPLFQIVLPGNALSYYTILMGVANFDILESERLQNWMFGE